LLLLVVSVPPHPSGLRVRVWRRLRALGAVPLKRMVYLLPDTPDHFDPLDTHERRVAALAPNFLREPLQLFVLTCRTLISATMAITVHSTRSWTSTGSTIRRSGAGAHRARRRYGRARAHAGVGGTLPW
jgi:hypothetical protein